MIVWSVHVDAEGDLTLNGVPIAEGGEYRGASEWPELLRTLRTRQPTGIRRLEVSVGSYARTRPSDWDHIRTLIEEKKGDQPGSNLYRNFQVLLDKTGADAVNSDDESCYDVASTVRFARMVKEIGFQNFTFAPYEERDYWASVRREVPFVDRVYLQCYAGGSDNADPAELKKWCDQLGPLDPGLWCRHGDDCAKGHSPTEMKDELTSWKQSADLTIPGGFLWLYDDIRNCRTATTYTSRDYATAINEATGSTKVVRSSDSAP